MVSRILSLLVVDILAVGLAMRLGQPGDTALNQAQIDGLDEGIPEPQASASRSATPGINAAGALAQMTSHSR
jgi:hypothetical protein